MKTVPLPIKQVLEECHSSFTVRGELPASERLKIYKKIEEFCANENPGDFEYKMAKLELTCAWKVLNIWESCDLTDNLARELLELAEKFLQGEAEEKELQEKRNCFYNQADDIMDNGKEYFTAGYAAFACISATRVVLYGFELATFGQPEIEIDHDEWTAAFLANIAYCGSATWGKDAGDDLKRKEFWKWFLDEAVPSLWQT